MSNDPTARPSLLLRPYALGDREGCLEVFDSNVGEYLHAEERPDFDGWLSAPKGVFLSLERDGQVIGCGGHATDLIPASDRSEPELRMTWGLLHRQEHGRGLGDWLFLARLVHGAKTTGVARASLGTTPRVAPFFERFGFRRIAYRPDGWGPGLHRLDLILGLQSEVIESLEQRLLKREESLGGVRQDL